MPKYVVSTTVQDPEWSNTHVVAGDVAAELRRIKEAPGGPVVQYGIGPVTRLLLAEGLLDELRLWVHPLVLGLGRPPLRGVADGRLRARGHHDAEQRHRDPRLPTRGLRPWT